MQIYFSVVGLAAMKGQQGEDVLSVVVNELLKTMAICTDWLWGSGFCFSDNSYFSELFCWDIIGSFILLHLCQAW